MVARAAELHEGLHDGLHDGLHRGIALPMVLLVLAALGLLSSLALFDALQATRGARLAEGEARARAAAIAGVEGLLAPPDLRWLCVQSPATAVEQTVYYESGARAQLRWRMLGRGAVRGEVEGVWPAGGRHRRLALLVPDSVPLDSVIPGCPAATRLVAVPGRWLLTHPDG